MKEAQDANLLGADILGSGVDFPFVFASGRGRVYLWRGKPVCWSRWKAKAGQPPVQTRRSRPQYGVFGKPTTINNTETPGFGAFELCAKGLTGSSVLSVRKTMPGTKVFSVSGSRQPSGAISKCPWAQPFRELLEMAGGMLNGKKLKSRHTRWIIRSCTSGKSDHEL